MREKNLEKWLSDGDVWAVGLFYEKRPIWLKIVTEVSMYVLRSEKIFPLRKMFD